MPKKEIRKKSLNDKFYTKPDIAEKLAETFKTYLTQEVFLIEPSCGEGAFSNCFTNILSFDIDPPSGVRAYTRDFLDVKEEELLDKWFSVIGNPPFGVNNKSTNLFLKKCISFKNIKLIGFVLPKTYMKYTRQQVFPDEWKLIYQESLPINSFLLGGEDYHVPCVFQIWGKEGDIDLREKPFNLENEIFKFDKEYPDFFIFGAAPKKIINPLDVKATNRGYFVKSIIDKDRLKELILSIDWNSYGKSSVKGGVFWITKSEFTKKVLEVYQLEKDAS